MAKVANNITELIGRTPLLELTKIEKEQKAKAQIVAKLEFLNPGRSVKDRVGLKLIDEAECKGLIGNPKNRVSVVSFDIPGIPAPQVGQMLDKEGIAVRAGHHCAQPALRALGYEMSVRPTFAVYNTREEVDRLVIALRKIVGVNN